MIVMIKLPLQLDPQFLYMAIHMSCLTIRVIHKRWNNLDLVLLVAFFLVGTSFYVTVVQTLLDLIFDYCLLCPVFSYSCVASNSPPKDSVHKAQMFNFRHLAVESCLHSS
jgi:hypothetical protein